MNEPTPPFQPGDVVALKSGGRLMTVQTVEYSNFDKMWVIGVVWNGENGSLYTAKLAEVLLLKTRPT